MVTLIAFQDPVNPLPAEFRGLHTQRTEDVWALLRRQYASLSTASLL